MSLGDPLVFEIDPDLESTLPPFDEYVLVWDANWPGWFIYKYNGDTWINQHNDLNDSDEFSPTCWRLLPSPPIDE